MTNFSKSAAIALADNELKHAADALDRFTGTGPKAGRTLDLEVAQTAAAVAQAAANLAAQLPAEEA